jgi:hypothetical protein
MTFLMSLFIATTVFGIGVIIIDLFGILSHFDSSGHDGIGHDTHHLTDDIHHGAAHEDDQTSKLIQDHKQKSNPVVFFLNLLRNAVYFSAGFGPAGLFMQMMKKGTLETLFWSITSGIVIMGMTVVIKRIIPKDTIDSQITDEDLLMAGGEVTVSVERGKMGKVRLFFDGFYTDRFAVSKDPEKPIAQGTKIRVVEVRDESLVIEEEKIFEDNLI